MYAAANAPGPREILVKAIFTEDVEAQIELVRQLAGTSDDFVVRVLAAWRLGELYAFDLPDGRRGRAAGRAYRSIRRAMDSL